MDEFQPSFCPCCSSLIFYKDMHLPFPPKKKDDSIYVVIETPRGSTNKYTFNPAFDGFELTKVLPFGTQFPLDFGFVPHTLGEGWTTDRCHGTHGICGVPGDDSEMPVHRCY
jgi:inorganic pyrophosphatase